MAVTKYQANECAVSYITTAVAYDAATPLPDEAGFSAVASMKNVTITPPEMTVEKIDCLGSSAQTMGVSTITAGASTGIAAGSFQNQALSTQSVGTAKISGTVVVTGDEQFINILGTGTGAAITTTASRRHTYGNANASVTRVLVGAMRVALNNSSEELTCVFSNLMITKLGDIKPTGADGHFEREFEGECLAKDYAEEFLD